MPVISNETPVSLTVAGSDCSCGAGAQADLKTFSAHGVYGLTVLTCVVAEVPGKVERIETITPEMVGDQLRLLLASFPVGGIKTGMIPTTEHVEAISAVLDAIPEEKLPPIVVDPVMVATSGDRLVDDDAISAFRTKLFGRAVLLTPNMAETSVLLGRPVDESSQLEDAARELVDLFSVAVLVKGGHLRSGVALDCLVDAERNVHRFESELIPDRDTHGTGCTLSSAIAANLAKGESLENAVRLSKAYVHEAIEHLMRWAGPVDALNHFAQPKN